MYFPINIVTNKGAGKHEIVKNSTFLVNVEPNYKSNCAENVLKLDIFRI